VHSQASQEFRQLSEASTTTQCPHAGLKKERSSVGGHRSEEPPPHSWSTAANPRSPCVAVSRDPPRRGGVTEVSRNPPRRWWRTRWWQRRCRRSRLRCQFIWGRRLCSAPVRLGEEERGSQKNETMKSCVRGVICKTSSSPSVGDGRSVLILCSCARGRACTSDTSPFEEWDFRALRSGNFNCCCWWCSTDGAEVYTPLFCLA
jgi:hypothetical protein